MLTQAPRPRPGILEITPYVGGKAEAGGAAPAAKLSANESAIGPSPRAVEAYRAGAGALHRYPDGGSLRLRQAIGRRFNLDPERIVCGAGSDELIALLTRGYAGPGDEVLTSRHAFLMYKLAALAAGAHVVEAPEPDLRADVDALLARVTSRTRILFLANPNNPTGSYLTLDELERLHAGLAADTLLVIDGAYAEFVTAPGYSSGLELALRHQNVVMTRTFSKLFGLAALRVGWMLGSAGVIDVLNRVRGPFNVSEPAQAAAVAALEDVGHQQAAKAHNDRWLPWLAETLTGQGYKVFPSVGNFVLVEFPHEPGRNAAAAADYLEQRGLIPRQMAAYGLPAALRLSIGQEAENRALADALGAFARRPSA
jgi:histidinol-phosphate aminotransferase